MRFIVGAPPEDPDFQPESADWRGLREPDAIVLQLYALPAMIVFGGLVAFAIAFGTRIRLGPALFWFLPAFVVMIPLHELIHALSGPSFGMSRHSVIGVWPSRAVFFAHYEGALSRERFLLILSAPIVILTVLPLGLASMFAWSSPWLGALAFANSVGAAGDIVGIIIILAQIPRGATVRNQGWRTFWMPAPPSAADDTMNQLA